MKIRVEGTRAEVDAAVQQVRLVLNVQEVSHFYPNRGASTLGRVYLTIGPSTSAPPVRADAARADRPHRTLEAGRG